MNNQCITQIDKLMLWRTNKWNYYEPKSDTLNLRIHYDQLLITSDTKILESFNMNSRMKGIYKGDILILIVSITGQEIRKLKFQIKGDVVQCLDKLGDHFPVMDHKSLQSKNTSITKYRDINEVLRNASENKESSYSLPLPPDFGNFVKLCLLDPFFPQIVLETNRILQDAFIKK